MEAFVHRAPPIQQLSTNVDQINVKQRKVESSQSRQSSSRELSSFHWEKEKQHVYINQCFWVCKSMFLSM